MFLDGRHIAHGIGNAFRVQNCALQTQHFAQKSACEAAFAVMSEHLAECCPAGMRTVPPNLIYRY